MQPAAAINSDTPTTTQAPFGTILQVLPALGTQGGVERGTVEVAGAIAAAGGRALVASAGGPLTHALTRVGATHVALPVDRKNPAIMARNVGRLADLIRRENVDLVHARSRAPAWTAWFAAKRTGRPFITTFHGTYNAGSFIKRRYNAIMTQGERVIAISHFIAGHIRQVYGLPAERLRVIHRGIDPQRFDPAAISAQRIIVLANQWRVADGLPVILLPGRLTRWKGQAVLLQAMARLGRRDVHCLLLGDDQGRNAYRAELEAMISRLGLGGVVRIIAHCDDMPAAYMLADVVVSASTDAEAFGRIVVEAQAMGRPVIATDHGGPRETIIDQTTGWLVPPADSEILAAALDRALRITPEARKRMAETAVDHVRRNFSTETMCHKTLDVYAEVLWPHADFG